jgi:hypothetical protein
LVAICSGSVRVHANKSTSFCEKTTQIRYAACKILSAVSEQERMCSRR